MPAKKFEGGLLWRLFPEVLPLVAPARLFTDRAWSHFESQGAEIAYLESMKDTGCLSDNGNELRTPWSNLS